MNVVILSTYQQFGGAAVATGRLHRALQKHGVQTTLLVGTSARQERHQPAPDVTFLANNFLAEQTAFGRFVAERLYFLPFERDPSVRFHFSPAVFGTGLNFHPAIQQADVIHLHWTSFGFLSLSGLRSLFDLGKPVVWTLHDQWAFTGGCHYTGGCDHFLTHCHHCPYLKKPGDNDLSARRFDRKQWAYANAPLHLVHPSRWLADQAERSTLLGGFPHQVIHNTLDQQVFTPHATPDTTVPRLLFGSANVTDSRKGFSFFAEALTLLHQQFPDLKPEILVFGKGRSYLFNELPYPIRQLGILTHEDDIVAAYNAATAMVVPSLEDNLPNTIVEALSCGTPVVGFRTGGIPEMIDHQQNGYLAAVGSAQELADGLAFILTHPEPGLLRQQARRSAEGRFSEVHIARQHIELYQSLLSEN
ncbi:glycosyltransferase [Spirosoma utsteinense]|uniref:Glycosyltransferase involved in cell wall biosynthesis n=1 Tax=Spirosoma utsteinense TaxID=2585773 RepID=A0ABR6W8S2_9BACT|nr:glycosyltransferase [Spirosoma utsteinense]MBC3787274.1 glycosyltransferase involved in cell wall biosynthesis [Spirosoma utsteinense]MBC3792960.1 glycosyltransferase involved in cell wall biosynthesis [Spirosoma utsteinense]